MPVAGDELERRARHRHQRRHGALDAAASAALDAHRAGCESCRRFDDDSAELDRAMRERVAEELKQVDWSKVEARVARIREEARHTLPRSIAMGVVLVLLIGWANGGPDLAGYLWAGAQAAGACALVAGFMWWAMRRRAREAAAAQRSALELVVFYRRQVDERLRVTSFGRWFLLLMGLVWLASIAGAHTAGQITLQLFMGVITLAWAVVTSRDHRRLVAEKRELA